MAEPLLVKLAELAVSLGGIVLLAWLARRWGLGGDVRLGSEEAARAEAAAALPGFCPVAVALDRAGMGALVRDQRGRVLLLRRHGAHFAARLLDSHAHVRLDRQFLTVGTGERFFAPITLNLGESAQEWAGSLRWLGAAA